MKMYGFEYEGRYGTENKIIKPFRWKDPYNRIGSGILVLDTGEKTIDIRIVSDLAPYATDIIYFLLSDRHVRKMIREYQSSSRIDLYKINKTVGMSGRRDYYINFYQGFEVGGFPEGKIYGVQTSGKKLLHVSCAEKINFGWRKMYIGDFVELVVYMQRNEELGNISKKELKEKCNCWHEVGYFADDATSDVSHII